MNTSDLAEAMLGVLATAALLGILSLPFVAVPGRCSRQRNEPKSGKDKFLDALDAQRNQTIRLEHKEERRKLVERYVDEEQTIKSEHAEERRKLVERYTVEQQTIRREHEEERRKLAERYAAEKQALEEKFGREDRDRV